MKLCFYCVFTVFLVQLSGVIFIILYVVDLKCSNFFSACCSCVLRWLCSVFFVFLQVAVQLALLISKIARFDYPREWYVLFHLLNPDVSLFVNLILICVIESHVRVMEHILSLTFKSLVMPF